MDTEEHHTMRQYRVGVQEIGDLIAERVARFKGGEGMVLMLQNGLRIRLFFVNGVHRCSWNYTEHEVTFDVPSQAHIDGAPVELALRGGDKDRLVPTIRARFNEHESSQQQLTHVVTRGWDYDIMKSLLLDYQIGVRISFHGQPEPQRQTGRSSRAEVVETVSQAMEHIIPRIRFTRGSKADWIIRDPYFLGYMKGFAVNCVVLYAHRFDNHSDELRSVAQSVIAAVFGEHDGTAIERMLKLEQGDNPEYTKGVTNGKIASDALRDDLDETLPVVVKARSGLGVAPDAPEYLGKLVDKLHQMLLFDYFLPAELKEAKRQSGDYFAY